jgi:sn-1 stearoyl-lipid 9-desaturase
MRTKKRLKSINWSSTLFLTLFHVGAIGALFMFSWQGLAIALILAWLAGGLGVGVGYHRLLTHRGYKTPKWVEYILTICGMLSLEGGAINWVVYPSDSSPAHGSTGQRSAHAA